jgi:acyl-CoA thioester hydrolase
VSAVPTPFVHQVRVIFGDTDQMAVVYYANYLRYFEAARAALLRELGSSGQHLAAIGVAFPVIEAHCRYRRPARYDDLVDVELTIESMAAARVRFAYRLRRGGELLADGWTEHACLGDNGRPRRIPDDLRAMFARVLPIDDAPAAG